MDVKERVSEELGMNPEEWRLGQGTIYPDRIESGATAHSHKIKTHHNRVGRIEELLEKGLVVEPIGELYKDEVRNLGRILGLGDFIVDRHPFPGPGLAVRCLCLDEEPVIEEDLKALVEAPEAELSRLCRESGLTPHILPVNSVGVQGDKRSYARPLALFADSADFSDWDALGYIARQAPNRVSGLNRVVFYAGGKHDPEHEGGRFRARYPAYLTRERMEILRAADHAVTGFLREKNIYNDIWQFPVVLVPVYFATQERDDPSDRSESIILRPVNSTEAMTASSYRMEFGLMRELTARLLKIPNVDGVYYDLTSKPPGTIEWE